MKTCNSCGSNYDPSNVNIPNPIPDGMCAHCGTVLTQEKIDELISWREGNGDYQAHLASQLPS